MTHYCQRGGIRLPSRFNLWLPRPFAEITVSAEHIDVWCGLGSWQIPARKVHLICHEPGWFSECFQFNVRTDSGLPFFYAPRPGPLVAALRELGYPVAEGLLPRG